MRTLIAGMILLASPLFLGAADMANFTKERFEKDLVGQKVKIGDGSDWKFSDEAPEKTTVKNIKSFAFNDKTLTVHVEVDAYLC